MPMRYRFADACLDTQRYELQRAGVCIPLRPKVFQVLACLLAQRHRVVSKEELLAHVWPGVYVDETTLNSYIMAVRQAWGDDGQSQRLVRTVRGRGYRFVAPVEVQDETSPADSASIERPLAADVPAATAVPSRPQAPYGDGEYKPVSVLCCGLLETMALGPEELYGVMQTVVGLAHQVVQRYAGLIMHHTPEGFTAVFGVPMAQEDHARRAVLAALDLRQHLRQPSEQDIPVLGAGLAVSMGVHSGLVGLLSGRTGGVHGGARGGRGRAADLGDRRSPLQRGGGVSWGELAVPASGQCASGHPGAGAGCGSVPGGAHPAL
jgi:DNA-binding winged helix-turn-helix (wHTH) protein